MLKVKNDTNLDAEVQYLGEFIKVPAGKSVEMKEDAAEFMVTAMGFLTIEKASSKKEVKKDDKKESKKEVKEDK